MQLENNNANEISRPKTDLSQIDISSFEYSKSKLYSIREEERDEKITEMLNQKDFDGNDIVSNEDKEKINDMLKSGGLTSLGALDLLIKMTDENETLAQVYEKTFKENNEI